MIFPDGAPDPMPTAQPATSCDDMKVLKSSPDSSSEGPEAALERLERPKTANEASGAADSEQTAIEPSATEQLTSSQHHEEPLKDNGHESDQGEVLIGMALGDPGEDSALTTNHQEGERHGPLGLTEQATMPTTEESTTVTSKALEEPELSPMPATREEVTGKLDLLHSEEPSTTSSSPIPYPSRQKDAPGFADLNKPLKRKPSRWNILGGLFGKKNVPPASVTTPIYQMRDHSKPTSNHKETVLIGPESLGMAPKGKNRFHRSRSSSTRLTKSKGGARPAFRRTRTAPSPHPLEHGPNPSSKESDADNTFPKLQLDGEPLLSVDIPDIQLDRYSVMFGGLLQPPPPQPQPSLLVRRQAHLENVKTDSHHGEVLVLLTARISYGN